MNTPHILFADDNPGDRMLVREALEASNRGTGLCTVSNGEEVLKFLRRQHPYLNAPKPDVVLLDLNMPRMDGIETLREIRADEALKSTPVVIFSSSTAPHDCRQADIHHASDYVIKPAMLDEFMRTIYAIETAWCIPSPSNTLGAA